ncbi:MAG: modulator of FtsH protease HflC [Verrucomicrobiota bacterium]|jgi:membrane protease subunit HflC
MKKNSLTLIVGFLLIVLFALLLFVFQVRTTQVAVVTTFGKPTRPVAEPGAYFKWPWPIQKVYYFDKRVQNFEDKFTEDLTADNNNLLTSVYIGWRITDPKEFFPKFAGGSVTEAEKVLEGLLRSSKSAVIGKHALSDFVSANADGSRFSAIETEILGILQSQIHGRNYGIEIEFLGIKRIGLPETVTQSVFDRMTSERQVLISKSQYEGESEALKIRSGAERRAAEIISIAEGQATQIRGRGEAEAAKSLAVFQQNPELASFLFRLTALENSLKDRSTLIFDQQTPPFNLFQGGSTNLVK